MVKIISAIYKTLNYPRNVPKCKISLKEYTWYRYSKNVPEKTRIATEISALIVLLVDSWQNVAKRFRHIIEED